MPYPRKPVQNLAQIYIQNLWKRWLIHNIKESQLSDIKNHVNTLNKVVKINTGSNENWNLLELKIESKNLL